MRSIGRRASRVVLAALCIAFANPPGAGARVFLTREKALGTVFGDSVRIQSRTATLSTVELVRANQLAGESEAMRDSVISYDVVFPVAAMIGADPLGTAYTDTHRVRTLDETIMVVIGPDDRMKAVQILRFDEPPEYAAPGRWLRRFEGRGLDTDLSRKGGVHGITGATLTARAITRAVQRALAVHRILGEREAARH